jgi:hypothetical protein
MKVLTVTDGHTHLAHLVVNDDEAEAVRIELNEAIHPAVRPKLGDPGVEVRLLPVDDKEEVIALLKDYHDEDEGDN